MPNLCFRSRNFVTARSLVAKEGADFSTALTDTHGALIAQGLTIGIHLGYIAGVMPWVLERYGDSLQPGDVIGGAGEAPVDAALDDLAEIAGIERLSHEAAIGWYGEDGYAGHEA